MQDCVFTKKDKCTSPPAVLSLSKIDNYTECYFRHLYTIEKVT